MRAFALLLVVSAVCVAGRPVAAQEVLPGLGIRLLEVPAELADDPRANTYIIDSVVPGTAIERRIAVSNGTDEAMSIDLYAAAASVEEGWIIQDGRGGNELADWISVSPTSLVLQPGQRESVTATVVVPADATGGERYAAVLAEAGGAGGSNVAIVNRVGIRVYLNVQGDVAPVTDFQIDDLTGGREAGAPYVRIGVTNTGDRAVDVVGELSLADGPGSLTAGPFPVALPRTIGPGASGTVLVELDPSLPDGPWTATADLQSGLIERQATATLTFPTGADAEGDPVLAVADDDGTGSPSRIPALAVGLGFGLLLLLIGVLLLLARRRRGRDAAEPAATPPPAGASAATAPSTQAPPAQAPPAQAPPAQEGPDPVPSGRTAPATAPAPPPRGAPRAPTPTPAPPTASGPDPSGDDARRVPAAPAGGPRSAPAAPPVPGRDR